MGYNNREKCDVYLAITVVCLVIVFSLSLFLLSISGCMMVDVYNGTGDVDNGTGDVDREKESDTDYSLVNIDKGEKK